MSIYCELLTTLLSGWMPNRFNNYREANKLNNSQLAGMIPCIAKGDKNRDEIKKNPGSNHTSKFNL